MEFRRLILLFKRKAFTQITLLCISALCLNSCSSIPWLVKRTYERIEKEVQIDEEIRQLDEVSQEDIDKVSAEINDSPNDSSLLRKRGRIYYLMSRYDKSLIDYDKAIRLSPNKDALYTERAKVHRLLGNYEKAVSDFTQAIKLNPTDEHNWAQRGNFYDEEGEFATALEDYDNAIKLCSRPDLFLTYRSITYAQLGKNKEALADLDRVLNGPRDDWKKDALENRAKIYILIGESGKAMKALDEWIAYDSSADAPFTMRGKLRQWLGEDKKAIQDHAAAAALCKKDIADEPDEPVWYRSCADALDQAGEKNKASQLRDQAWTLLDKQWLKDKKARDEILSNLSALYLEGNPSKAKQKDLLQKFEVQLKASKNADLIDDRGIFFFKTGQYKRAQQDFLSAHQWKPEESGYTANLIRSCVRLSQMDRAISLCKEALKEKPNDSLLNCTLAEVYAKTGHRQEALAALEKAIAVDRFDGTPYFVRANVLKASGDLEGSKKDELRASIFDHYFFNEW